MSKKTVDIDDWVSLSKWYSPKTWGTGYWVRNTLGLTQLVIRIVHAKTITEVYSYKPYLYELLRG